MGLAAGVHETGERDRERPRLAGHGERERERPRIGGRVARAFLNSRIAAVWIALTVTFWDRSTCKHHAVSQIDAYGASPTNHAVRPIAAPHAAHSTEGDLSAVGQGCFSIDSAISEGLLECPQTFCAARAVQLEQGIA